MFKYINLSSGYHGSLGPLKVSDSNVTTELTKQWFKAGKELGYPSMDINGENQFGKLDQNDF